MAAAERRFPPGNDYGVFAFGIERTTRRGLPGPFGLVVHVERKLKSPPARVPALELDGRAVHPDVVGTGRGAVASQGSIAAFTGLHPGGVIVCGDITPEVGAVACLLASDDDPVLLVTAGHLFPEDAAGMEVFAAPADSDEPLPIGVLNRNLLDENVSIDAALVELTGDGIVLAWETLTSWRIGPIVDLKQIDGLSSQVYSWRSGEFTEACRASSLPQTVHFEGNLRAFSVRGVVSSSPSTTAPGDSGAILVDASEERRAIGLCVGEFDRKSIFEPLDKILDALGDDVAGCRIWSNPS